MKLTVLSALTLALVSCDLMLGCDADPPVETAAAEEDAVDGMLDDVVARAMPQRGPHERAPTPAREEMPGARAAFEDVVALVQDTYVEGPLTEDAIYTAAVQGIMASLLQLPTHPVNTLMSPDQLAELEAGTTGSIVGVGVSIEMVGDVVVVREIVPGSPSEGANLKAGDRILGVDGERLRDLSLAEVVDRIRGEDGTAVELFVQRDTEEWNESLTRGRIDVQSVRAQLLEDGVGLLSINSFAEMTAQEVEAHLETLSEAGMTSLILDLRDCPGGLLESAVMTTDLLLPPGETIVVLEKRGAEAQVRKAARVTAWQELPLIALVGPHTASGAEIVVEALVAAERGTVVGQPTVGKGTVESIHALDNGWALKLSVARFHAQGSDRAVGEGVIPDILVATGEGEDDPQLDAAMKMLRR